MSDAFGTDEKYIHQLIIDMMDPNNYHNNMYKDSFLAHMSDNVWCCGADGPEDYANLFNISPPEECVNEHAAGGLYYEDGCAHKFKVYMMAWAGSVCGAMLVVSAFLIWMMVIASRLWKRIKKTGSIKYHDPFLFPSLPSTPPPTPPTRAASTRGSFVRFGGTFERRISSSNDELKLHPHPRTPPRRKKREKYQRAQSPSPSILKVNKMKLISKGN